MKKIGIWIFALLIIILLAKQLFSYKKAAATVVDNIYPIGFSGKVEVILNNRGFKIKLKDESKFFNFSGTCNDTACLAQNITWGDSLFKKPNSNIIILKTNSGRKVSKWKLPANPELYR
jgi:hypothetical protein